MKNRKLYIWTTPTNKIIISLSQNRSWPERSKPPRLCSWSGQDLQRNVETPSIRRISFSLCSVQQNVAAKILPWKMVRVHNNTISKPGKVPTIPSSYRPTALTTVLNKWMERMIDVRLLDFFDQKGTLSSLQCWDRAKQTTIDHLLSLEATVR